MDRICGVCQSPAGLSFTDKQGQYLAFIDAYARVHGRLPAETDMQRHFQVSPPSVHQMVLTLKRIGLIRRQPGWRAPLRCSWLQRTYPPSDTPNPSNPLGQGSRTTSTLTKPGRHSDGSGLYLNVTESGAKSWVESSLWSMSLVTSSTALSSC